MYKTPKIKIRVSIW